MEKKDINAFKWQIVFITIGEVFIIVFLSIYILAACVALTFAARLPILVPVVLIIGALLILVAIVSAHFKKAMIRCFQSITEDVHKIAEKE